MFRGRNRGPQQPKIPPTPAPTAQPAFTQRQQPPAAVPPRQPDTRTYAAPTMQAPPPPLRVITSDGRTIVCHHDPFNAGSEGRLFFTLDQAKVVKVYNRPEPWRRASLETIISKRHAVLGDNSEYWSHYFCWPEALLTSPSLGMMMPRARKNLRPFSHLLSPRFRKRISAESGPAALGTWIGHVGILIKLARTVNRLHANGLCHSDLSTNNLLVDPVNGEATLIDCDGLVETGSKTLLPTVLGTPDYMAPELVEGMTLTTRPAPQPSVNTDLHSLAILIYQGLLFRHPLRGGAFHSADPDEDERLMLGKKALFIEHPSNRTNRPKAAYLSSAILGADMQALFAKAFIDGLHDPSKRPLAAQWERTLVRMYDQTVPCSNPACEAKSFVLVEGGGARCPWCRTELKGPRQIPVLTFYRPDGKQNSSTFTPDFRLVAWPRRKLNVWHIELNKLPGPGVNAAPLAEISWTPDVRGQERWTLINTAIPQIYDATGGKNPLPIPQGQAIELKEATRLYFGGGERARVVEVHMLTI